MDLKIKAYLKEEEGGCKPSKHFRDNFINNDKLHPEVKNIPIEIEIIESDLISKIVLKDGDKTLHILRDTEMLRLDLYQEYILRLLS